ncbi:hypothetical protein [Mesorhizobium sp.]|uniref:hypothetical protein n=1 Tax=Mesorhizobium sp. TaxID=1871066 RepID=UPI003BACFD46
MKKTLTFVIVAQAAGALALLVAAGWEMMPGPAVAAQAVAMEKASVPKPDDCSKATWPNIPQKCLDTSSGAGRTVSAVVVIPNN